MTSSLTQFIAGLGVVDVHEHHMPEVLLNRDVNLLQLFQQSYAGWTQARPYPLPSETRAGDPMLAAPPPTSWEALEPYPHRSGSSSFVRNLVRAVMELHAPGSPAITRENWRALDEAVRQKHRQPDWCAEVLRRAGVERIITDPYSDPLLDARQALGANYSSVLRINSLACGWHPESRDHNGNRAHILLARLGLKPTTFDDYMAALEKLVDGLGSRNQVALKNALAYDRDLAFDEPDEKVARQAWGQQYPSPAERKAFSDFVVDRLCALAGQRTSNADAPGHGAHPRLASAQDRRPDRAAPSHPVFPPDAPGLSVEPRSTGRLACVSEHLAGPDLVAAAQPLALRAGPARGHRGAAGRIPPDDRRRQLALFEEPTEHSSWRGS